MEQKEEYDPLLRVSGVPDEHNIMYSADGRKVVGCRDCYLTEYSVREDCDTIAKDAFSNGGGLRKITLPDSIKTIGSRAFGGCTRLQELNIPDSVTHIGAGAFDQCTQLGRVVLPKSLKMLGAGCFGHSGVKEVESHSPEFECRNGLVTHLPTATLVACVSTSKVYTVPEGIRRIGHKAFTGNRSVQTVLIPSTVERMVGNPFLDSGVRQCFSHSKKYTVEDDFLIGEESRKLVAWLGKDKEVEIPLNIRTIGLGAFYGKVMLERVVLRKEHASEKTSRTLDMDANMGSPFMEVEKIGDYAFAYCEHLKEAFMPITIKEIGALAFFCCKQLVWCRIPSVMTKIKESAFLMCKTLNEVDNNTQAR